MPTITAARVITPDGVVAPGAVDVEDGCIVGVTATRGPVDDITLVPGLVDLQLNGFDDIDVATADGSDWDRLDEMLVRHGVTSWCPTIVTQPLERYAAPLRRIATAAATQPGIVGAHLEGPFLGGAPGAHDPAFIGPLDVEWFRALPAIVRIVTLAPEQPDAATAITALRDRGGVAALGHSTASYDDAVAAIDSGARLVTHCFNGMGPLHHRRPGLVGAALSDDRVAVSLIADLHHVHPAVVRLVFRAKRLGSVILVSDAVAWRDEKLRAAGVTADDGVARRPDGKLVGAVMGLDGAVRNAVGCCGVDLADAVHAASSAPAGLLGLSDRGRIGPGARADLVALDADLRVTRTWRAGVRVAG